MDEIPLHCGAVILFAVQSLREDPAPTSIGYNDMALMIAYGEFREYGIPTFNSRMISRF